MMEKRIILKIYRGTPGKQFWEEFELQLDPSHNITSALMKIQRSPINRQGIKVEPVVWEQGCLEEVCGSCSMLINGYPQQACTALIHKLCHQKKSPLITLAPMSKFPLIRDLVVNRDSMFEHLKRIRGWIDADGVFDRGFGPPQDPKVQEVRYMLSTCMSCGCCVEACPQVNPRSPFMGPAVISQVRLFNSHPVGKMKASERLHVLMEEGGIGGCGNAQNCARVCPKKIPLTESIALMGREVSKEALHKAIGLSDE